MQLKFGELRIQLFKSQLVIPLPEPNIAVLSAYPSTRAAPVSEAIFDVMAEQATTSSTALCTPIANKNEKKILLLIQLKRADEENIPPIPPA